MAHLPDDSLPSQFDVVIDGTGLVQSVLAAALSQAGKSVLHIDGNMYYGEQWASLMHRELNQWIAEHTGQLHDQDPTFPEVAPEAEDGEEIISLQRPSPQARISNVIEIVPDTPEEDPPQPPPQPPADDQGPLPSSSTTEETTQPPAQDNSGTSAGAEGEPVMEPEEPESEQGGGQGGVAASVEPQRQRVTWQSLESQRRRFNYDVIPKLLYCRGELVNILTRSNCARYVEFRAVNKIYTQMNGKIEQVPCSRSDVFSSKSVSMMEKRKMMKFLTFCSEFEKYLEEYEEFVSLPYVEFLRRKDLTPNLIQYIVHCIAMVNEQVPTLEGLKTTQIFLNSLGRFGNAPFLYPIFGAGELPQAFCRLCAVFGGVYCLRRHIQSLVVSRATRGTTGIICSTGQKISCSTVVSSAALLKDTLNLGESVSVARLSRGVFVTDGPIQNTEERLALLAIPPHTLGSNQTAAVHLLQLDPSTNSTAEGTFMVHMMCVSVGETAQQDLEYVARTLFKMDNETSGESNSAGPSLLWSLYYNATVCTVNQTQLASLDLPSGVHVTSDPDGTVAYENAMKEAQVLFERICPGVDFLPPPPDPEDIIYEENPGNEDTNESQEQTPSTTTEGGTQAVDSESQEQTPPTTTDGGTQAVDSESQEQTPPTATDGGTQAVDSESQEQTPPTATDGGTQAVESESQEQTPPTTTDGGTQAVDSESQEQTPPTTTDGGTQAVDSESQEQTPPTTTGGGTQAVDNESQEQTPPTTTGGGTQAVDSEGTNESQET